MKTSLFEYDLAAEINAHRARQHRRQLAAFALHFLGYAIYVSLIGFLVGAIIAGLSAHPWNP